MKKRIIGLFPVFIAVFILLTMCEKSPTASFTHSSNSYEAGDTIQFKNTSKDADAFEWNFGDASTISTEKNPWHIYYAVGNYVVTLKAENENGTDEDNRSLTIKNPTILGFSINQDTTEIPIPNCTVIIFENQSDLENGTNEAGIDVTDDEGLVLFYHAKAIVYYLYALKEETDGAWFFAGYTNQIILNMTNLYNVQAEWIPNKKALEGKTDHLKLLTRIQDAEL